MLTLQKPLDILSQILCRWNADQLRKQNALPEAIISNFWLPPMLLLTQGDIKLNSKDK